MPKLSADCKGWGRQSPDRRVAVALKGIHSNLLPKKGTLRGALSSSPRQDFHYQSNMKWATVQSNFSLFQFYHHVPKLDISIFRIRFFVLSKSIFHQWFS
jgi:hypothetical protein